MTVNVHSAIAPTGTRGQLLQSQLDGDVATYCATVGGNTAFVGDIFQIQGIANGVVRITHIDITIVGPSASVATVALQRRSTADTGGSPQVITLSKSDSGDSAPGSAPTLFTGVPTPGANVGGARQYSVQVVASGTMPQPLSLDFGLGCKKALTLRGIGDFMVINLNGSLSGASATFNVEWTESPN